MARRGALAGLALLLWGLAGPALAFAIGELTIDTQGGPRRFTIEIAATPRERGQGLMFRDSLAPDRGMLFDFGRVQPVGMWMKNTLIPLDMLFVDARGAVVAIAERTVPHSLETISPDQPVLAVLELAGGSADRLGLAVGDRLRHPIFERGS